MSLTATYRLGTRLFWRDRALLFASVITPIGLGVGLPVMMRHVAGPATASTVFQGMIAMFLSITAFMNVAVALTNRRDQLVLKRLRASRLTDGQILLGQVAGTATQTVVLIVLCTLAALLLADVPLPGDLPVSAVAVVAGSAVLSLLGAAYTALIPRAELAAAFTMPVFLVSLVSTGAMGPIPLPSWLHSILELLPTTAVVTAVRTGDLALPAGDLAVWAVAGLVATRLWFRWEPRRS
ncbi:ABC transporter permease [Nonomuraea sp. B12E4]|uniref:ABC transporter permease n=1 Tax=Nonomuraea sp. B12E4 TaxID=3153564 RepID=UPI00325D7A68